MSIGEQIESIIYSVTDNNIPPQVISILKVYPDNTCDIITNNNAIMRNIRCTGSVDNTGKGLLVFEDGKQDKPYVLLSTDLNDYYTKSEVDDLITGDKDLNDYVKKADLIDNTKYDVDLNLSFGLSGQDDSIIIDMDIVDHIVNKIIKTKNQNI